LVVDDSKHVAWQIAPMKHYPDRTTLLLRFGYDGARFHGLQPQPGFSTAGGALQARVAHAVQQQPTLMGPKGLAFSARTDRGVHAIHNLATTYVRGAVDAHTLCHNIEQDRDDGLVQVTALPVPHDVHARNVSEGKHYRFVVKDDVDVPVDDDRAWQIHPRIDTTLMGQAAAHLVGTHDFSSLRGSGCSAATTIKTLWHVGVERTDAGVVVDVIGDAFLRKMMRNMVALLVEAGTGWRSVDSVVEVLHARNRQAAGICAPPGGLTLVRVGSRWPVDGSWRLAWVVAHGTGTDVP
jgi:tRNA pseudouridine38-40 synthase